VQSCEAYSKKIPIERYAKTHKELAEAIKFFSKKKEVVKKAKKPAKKARKAIKKGKRSKKK
jgi:hypothetical protein